MLTCGAKLLALAGCLVLVSAGPVDRVTDKCATECSGTSTNFRYEIGKSYNYQYETKSKVMLAGTSQNEANVDMKAKVQISVISPCEYTLKLSQVDFQSAANLNQWKQELERYTTRFSFDNGEVGEICPKDDEPTYSVNIKRAILSAFQNAETGGVGKFEKYEEDICGRCPTTFEIVGEGDEKTITKTKNLISCFNRMGNFTALKLIPYEVRSSVQSNPIVDSKQTCRQTIRGNKLTETTCDETHMLRPFRNEDKGGIKAIISQKLQFVNEQADVARGDAGRAEKLYFDHSEEEHSDSSQALADARQNLKDLCRTSKDEVRLETPGLFNELVYNLRHISLANLKTLQQEATTAGDCPQTKEWFLNAVPMCADTACVSLMAEILKSSNNQLTILQKKTYYAAFALTPRVTKEMIVAVTPLIDTVSSDGLLGISTLVHTYCRSEPACGNTAEVKAIIQKLVSNLGSNCASTDGPQMDKIIYSLKALGNIGHSSEGVDKRANCIKTKTLPTEVRLAAIQSLRRAPCADSVPPLKERFADPEENVEIRLSSFLTFVQCAQPEHIEFIKDVLVKENINQVGSFVITYFHQMKSSADPCRSEIQRLLSTQQIANRFKTDPRKYSRFFEMSRFSNRMNFGGHIEGGFMFTPEGYLPRQGFVNLTVDLFGSAVNLLEIGGRTENLENALDNFIGPNGYFTNSERYHEARSKKEHSNPKIKELDSKYSRGTDDEKLMDLSMYVRVFGDEIMYKSIRNINPVGRINDAWLEFWRKFNTNSQTDFKLDRTNQLINRYFSLPTCSGLPLHLAMNGTVAIKVDFSGKADTTNFKLTTMDPKSGELRVSIKPSAAIELSTLFAIHAGNSKMGVRSLMRLHSSTAADVILQVKDSAMIKASFEMPKQKHEIVQFESKIYTIKNNVPVEEQGITENRISGVVCSPERISRWTGFKVCHEGSFPNASTVANAPYFPLTGPVRYAVTMEKTDPTLKTYEITVDLKGQPRPGTKQAKVSFNTPGSNIDRELTFAYAYQRGRQLTANLRTPLKKVDAVGTLEAQGPKQKATIKIKVDDRDEYTLTGIQETQRTATGHTKTFNGEIARPSKTAIKVEAKQTWDAPNPGLFKGDSNLQITNLYDTPLVLTSSVERTGPREGKVMYEMRSPKFNGKVDTKLKLDGDVRNVYALREGIAKIDVETTVDYSRPTVDPTQQKFNLKYKYDYTRQGPRITVTEALDTTCTTRPNTNLNYRLNFDKKPNQIDAKITAKMGSDRECGFEFASKREAENKQTGTASIKSTTFGLDHKADFVYQDNTPGKFFTSVKLDTPTLKDINAEVRYNHQPERSMEAEAKLKYTGRDLRVYKKVDALGQGKYKSQAIVQWQTDKKIQLDSDVTYDASANDYGVKSVIMGVDAAPWTFDKKVKIGQDMSVSTSASAKKGQDTLYDWKLDATRDGPTKRKISTQFKSTYITARPVDIAADGVYESLPTECKLTFTGKSNNREAAKGEIIIPKTIDYQFAEPEKRIKVDLTVTQPQSIIFFVDYHRTKPASGQIQMDAALKLRNMDMVAADCKVNAKISTGQSRSINVTVTGSDRKLMDVTVGAVSETIPFFNAPVFAVDLGLKTYEPMTKRDVSVLVTHKRNADQFDASVKAENLLENRRFAAGVSAKKQGDARRTLSTDFTFNERKLAATHEYTKNGEASKKVSGEIKYNDGQSGEKKIVHEYTVQTSPTIRVATKLQTPFEQMPNFEGAFETTRQGEPTHKHGIDLKWNQNQNFKAEVKRETAADYMKVDGTLSSTLTGLTDGKFELKSDMRTGRDLEAKLNWNNQANQLRAFHKREGQPTGQQKWSTGIESKLPNTANYRALADVEWDTTTGKYKASTETQTNGGAYKIKADFDTNTKEGTVEAETPNEKLRSAKATVTKIGDNEYELKMDQNAQSVGNIRAQLKLDQDKQKLMLEVKDIQKPFKTEFEHEWSPTRFAVGGKVSTDVNDPTKAFGMKVAYDRISETARDVLASLTYPSRTVQVHHKRLIESNKVEWLLEIQPKDGVTPTKLEAKYNRPTPEQINIELHVTDNALPKGIHLTETVRKTGNCTMFARELCSISMDTKMQYSEDTNKDITWKMNAKREIVGQRKKYTYEHIGEQKANKVFVKVFGNLLWSDCGENQRECSREGQMGVEVFDKSQSKNVQYLYKMNTDSCRNLEIEGVLPGRTRKLIGNWDGQQLNVSWNYSPSGEGRTEVLAGFDTPDREWKMEVIDVTGTRNRDVLYHMGARKPSPDQMEFRVWHSERNNKVDDINVITSLTNHDSVKSRIYIRPDAQQYYRSLMERAVGNIQNAGAEAGSSPIGEFLKSREQMKQDFQNTVKPVFDHWVQEQDAIGNELGVNFGGLRTVIVNYVQALRDVRRTVQSYLTELLTRITSSVPSRTLQQMYQDVQAFMPRAANAVSDFITTIQNSLRTTAQYISDMAENWRQIRIKIYAGLRIDELKAYVNNAMTEAGRSPIVQKLLEWFGNMKSLVPDLSWDRVKNTATDLREKATQRAVEGRDKVMEQADSWRQGLKANEETRPIVVFLEELYKRLVWAFTNMEPTGRAQAIYEWMTGELRNVGSGGIAKKWLPSINESQPDQGIYVVEVPLPKEYKSFNEIAQQFQIERLVNMKNTVANQVNTALGETDHTVRHFMNSIQPTSLTAALHSPLSSTAFLVGDSHYVTFDGVVYNFAGDCDYLLARDFEKGEFTLVVDYETRANRVTRKALIFDYWLNKVEISNENKVKINGQETELPWHEMDEEYRRIELKVYRRDHSVIVETVDGIEIDCDGHFSVCRITIPRRYHGKSAGLLGVNDFEPYDDLTKPDRTIATDATEMTREWSVNTGCSVTTNQAKTDSVESGPLYDECNNAYWTAESTFRSCFRYVEPYPYFSMCLNDVKQQSNPASGLSSCNSSAAYVEACAEQGISLDLPTSCVTCKLNGAVLTEDEDVKRIDNAQLPDAADVVFLIELRDHVNYTKAFLPEIARQIDTDLKQKRYDTRFGLIGFNGDGVSYEPQFYTGQGSISLTLSAFTTAVSNLRYRQRSKRLYQDPLLAVRHAADHFPFRAGARKLLVLFSVEDCGALAVNYFDLQNDLLELGIGLHMVTVNKIELASGTGPELLAVDASTLYTPQGESKTELRSQLVSPHDSCTVLAQETNGTVFSFAPPANSAALKTQLSRKVVQSITTADKCQMCKCMEHEHAPRTVCYTCEPARPASLASDNTGFFNNPFVRLQRQFRKNADPTALYSRLTRR